MLHKIFTIITMVLIAGTTTAQEEIKLYPNGANEDNGIEAEKWRDNEFLSDVNEARMYAYFAPEELATGAAVLICPGGGYAGVSVIKEGKEFAEWLNSLGISAFVLYYRMPNGNHEIPLKDAQTALGIIRENVGIWHLKRDKIGVAGFSAGGHLASTLGTHFTSDENRPDFMILLYPVITMNKDITHAGSRNKLLGENPSEELVAKYSNELQVTKNTPPTFIMAAINDKTVSVENSRLFYEALKKNKITTRFKTYEEGGHGFGLREQGLPVDKWYNLLKFWLKGYGYVTEE